MFTLDGIQSLAAGFSVKVLFSCFRSSLTRETMECDLKQVFKLSILFLIYFIICSTEVFAYTANKVWFEFRDNGRYRVYVNYTVPELKEFRESWIDFTKKKEAEKFYWALVRGGDFYPPSPDNSVFKRVVKPRPW